MSRVALRLLLALCLILNGIGNALAASVMPGLHGEIPDTVALAASPESKPSSPCDHGSGTDTGTDARENESRIHALAPGTHPGECGQDCCAERTCNCQCMHLVQATLLEMAPPLPALSGRTQVMAAFSLGHPAPEPPEFIRPPIG